ncbi:MAG: RNA polymerase sigma factor [Bacteroidales bacterium]|nr:RNA polymerase sigma factor [Bacteroidales bacterium]MCF8403056.1 RNA polymerase sigma factor [Bacteroidales bacterium]
MTVETFKIEVLPIKNKLYRFAYRLMKSIPEAEDIVQDVFIKLWSNKKKLAEIKSIEAFAMTMTKNLCLDRLKSKKYGHYELTEQHDEINDKTPFVEVEQNDAYQRVRKLIEALPEQQRMIIHLRDIEGYEYAEIAEVLNITENTIRVNLSRARRKIRDTMVKNYNYEFTKN